MARRFQEGETNKSEEIRQLIRANPSITAPEAIDTLANRGITVGASLFYFTKGRMKGRKGRRRKIRRSVANVIGSNGTTAPTTSDVLATIRKVKAVAVEVGGLRK